jgi:hypothetical protein
MRTSSFTFLRAHVLVAFILAAGALAAQTPPDKFLGHKPGEDRKLADYVQIRAYFERLAQESTGIKLFTIGESVLKKPIIMAAISTPENLAKLDRWKEIAHKLRDPRATPVDEAAYPEDEILMSGWLLGEEHLARKAAVVDTKWKDGRIILIGIRCQNRAQSHGTYKFLLNALLYPVE